MKRATASADEGGDARGPGDTPLVLVTVEKEDLVDHEVRRNSIKHGG
jgi:hypothetical protein